MGRLSDRIASSLCAHVPSQSRGVPEAFFFELVAVWNARRRFTRDLLLGLFKRIAFCLPMDLPGCLAERPLGSPGDVPKDILGARQAGTSPFVVIAGRRPSHDVPFFLARRVVNLDTSYPAVLFSSADGGPVRQLCRRVRKEPSRLVPSPVPM